MKDVIEFLFKLAATSCNLGVQYSIVSQTSKTAFQAKYSKGVLQKNNWDFCLMRNDGTAVLDCRSNELYKKHKI